MAAPVSQQHQINTHQPDPSQSLVAKMREQDLIDVMRTSGADEETIRSACESAFEV